MSCSQFIPGLLLLPSSGAADRRTARIVLVTIRSPCPNPYLPHSETAPRPDAAASLSYFL